MRARASRIRALACPEPLPPEPSGMSGSRMPGWVGLEPCGRISRMSELVVLEPWGWGVWNLAFKSGNLSSSHTVQSSGTLCHPEPHVDA